MPPQVNAHVTRITAQRGAGGQRGAFDDWDRQAAPPPDPDATGPMAPGDEWLGRIEAYYREKVDRVPSEGGVTVFTRRTVWVDTAALDGIPLDTHDVVVVELEAGGTIESAVRTIARSRLGSAPRTSTTRLDLEDA